MKKAELKDRVNMADHRLHDIQDAMEALQDVLCEDQASIFDGDIDHLEHIISDIEAARESCRDITRRKE